MRCQACGRGLSSRRHTPLYYLKTSAERIEMCLWLLAEGVDLAVLVRFTHHVDATLSRWLERAGKHSEKLHQQLFVNLELAYVQIDEPKALIVGNRENWLWTAIEPRNPEKLNPCSCVSTNHAGMRLFGVTGLFRFPDS